MELKGFDRILLTAIEDGLPLDPRPYACVAEYLGTTEEVVIERLSALQRNGVIRRFGVIVRHRELGYTANAMVVWDVPDRSVREIGRRIAELPGVTLCYRRPRRPPVWPYNLFAMVHGRDRAAVERVIDRITEQVGLEGRPRAILFSRRRFKQRGARYPASSAPAQASVEA